MSQLYTVYTEFCEKFDNFLHLFKQLKGDLKIVGNINIDILNENQKV